MKSILFFDLKAPARRRLVKSGVMLDLFSSRTWRSVARDDVHAEEIIKRVAQAAGEPVRILVTDESVFAAGWGISDGSVSFGGPFK